jgi:tRNA (guanine-N7-)-methyltransferase
MTSPPPELNTPVKTFSDTQIELNQFEEKINWEKLYPSKGPVIIEIGSGRGRFIIKSAEENPDKNFLGIEKSLKYSRVLNKCAEKVCLTNLRLLNAEAGYFVSKYIPFDSVSEYHIYFPDPWPKKRHNKRRLINPAFLKAITLSLKPGGCIYYATDFKNYFDQMVEVSRACEGIEETLYQEINPADEDPEAALTNYERKYLIQGRLIYKASYEKCLK